MAKYRYGLAVFVSATFLLFSPAAKAALVTLDIFGVGSGSLNATPFTNQLFNFHLEGPDSNNNSGIALTMAQVTIGNNGNPLSFSFPTLANLNFGPDYAFIRPNTNNGGLSGSDDLIQLFFSAADFLVLANSNLFVGPATSISFPSFQNIATSGGPLTFTSATNVFLLAQSSGVTSAVPELSTWVMMLIGFAGVGFLAYRRGRNRSAVFAT